MRTSRMSLGIPAITIDGGGRGTRRARARRGVRLDGFVEGHAARAAARDRAGADPERGTAQLRAAAVPARAFPMRAPLPVRACRMSLSPCASAWSTRYRRCRTRQKSSDAIALALKFLCYNADTSLGDRPHRCAPPGTMISPNPRRRRVLSGVCIALMALVCAAPRCRQGATRAGRPQLDNRRSARRRRFRPVRPPAGTSPSRRDRHHVGGPPPRRGAVPRRRPGP